MEYEVVGELRAEWGEGPIWWQGVLYYVDIEGGKVVCYDPKLEGEQVWELGQRVGTVVPRRRGGLLFAGDKGIYELDVASGESRQIVDPEHDLPDNRFNDGKCSPDGRFFAGTMSCVKKEGSAALYRLDSDCSLEKVYGDVTTSNGLGWSPDGKTFFYIDTPRREVLAFDYDADSGDISNPRSVVDTSHIDASPDGMAIDAKGVLWIAFCHAGCVAAFDPQSGEELTRINLPVREVTAVAFGGDELRDLYVTSGVPKTEVEEFAGRLFVIRGMETPGLPGNAFSG